MSKRTAGAQAKSILGFGEALFERSGCTMWSSHYSHDGYGACFMPVCGDEVAIAS